MRGKGKCLAILLLVLPVVLSACGDSLQLPQENSVQVDPVIVKSIVPVERRVDGSGASELSVPETSVFHRGALTGVYVVGSDGRAVIRWINPGRSRDGDVVVLGGLDEGEKIVGSASSQLEEGVPVKEQVTETEERKTNE